MSATINRMAKLTGMLFTLLFSLLAAMSETASAVPYSLYYSGRMTDGIGAPIEGPVDLEMKFFRSELNQDEIAVTVPTFFGTSLDEGVFGVSIDLLPADFNTVFNDAGNAWIQVRDITHDTTFPRQVFSVVPYALKVPVDGTSLTYNSDGKLQVGQVTAASVAGSNGTSGQILTSNGSGSMSWQTASGTYPSGDAAKVGFISVTSAINLDAIAPSKIAQDSSNRFVTDANKTTWNGKQAAGNYITALTGDITASGPNSAAATIADGAVTLSKISVSGCSDGTVMQKSGINWTCATVAASSHNHAATDITQDSTHKFVTDTNISNWGSAYTLTSGATSLGTGDTLVRRDGSGNFTAGTITATLNGTATAAGTATTATTAGSVTGIVAVANGGTGQNSLTSGALLMGNGTSAVSAVTMSGDATIASNGSLTIGSSAITDGKIASGITASKITQTSSYNFVTTTEKNTWNAKQDAITTLGVTNGGTGQTTLTSGALLLGNGTSGISSAVGTTGQIPISNGTVVSMTGISGDATLASTGALTIANNAVTSVKINTGAISDSHVSGSAAVAVNKLAAGTTGQVLVTSSGGQATWKNFSSMVKDRSCDTGNANDVMVAVGTWCVDKYEASIWSAADGTGTAYFSDGTSGDYNYPDAGNLPASFNRDGSGSSAVYAVSKPDVIPSRGLTWYQASVACAMSGKQLIPDSVWQLAATGTADPGASTGTGGTSGGSSTDGAAAKCNTATNGGSGNWTSAGGGARPTNRAGATSGDANACISRFGVHDMVGNLWEWTDMNGQQAGTQSGFSQGMMQSPTMLGKDDGTWNINGSTYGYNGTTYGWINGAPAAALRGGHWTDSTNAGVFARHLSRSGSYSDWGIGFRCARPR